ncbi:MAG: TetR family transcriptional regulator [Microthrixaceae bacterium]|nr:TetR family transcriptional regulator [Microthrixaceae bacterium]MCO5312409.1 TetR family transcriptional regulator [Microthrixaceae bacterium]
MLNVASRLAREGGYDAVQMRAVANEADVALGTLYRYFPSKEHLLVSAMLRQIESLHERLAVKPPQGLAAMERLVDVLRRANGALQRQQQFTVAVVRALVSGDELVAPVVRDVRDLMGGIILSALETPDSSEPSVPTQRALLVTEILQEVWLSSLVAWISGVEPASSVDRKLEAAVHLLFGEA